MTRTCLSSRFFTLFMLTWLSLAVTTGAHTGQEPGDANASAKQIQFSEAQRDWLKNHPVIRIAIPDNIPAICMLNEQGQREGFLVDYFEEIQRVSGIQFEYHYMEVTESYSALKRGEVDVIVTVKTSEWEKDMNFTRDFFSVPFVIITRIDETNVTGRQWLAGKRVAALRNFATEKSLLNDSIPIQVIPVDSNLQGLQAVSFGQADAFLGALLASGYNIKKHRITNLKVAAESGYPDYDARLGARKDWPELIEIIDQTIDAIPNEKRNELLDRWMSVRMDDSGAWQNVFKWVSVSVVTLLVLLLISIIWNRQLKKQVALRTQELDQSNQILRESEERFRNTFEQASVGMVHTALDGHLLRVNPRFCEMLGYSCEEMIKLTFGQITHPDDMAQSRQAIEQLLDGTIRNYHAEKRYLAKDGSVIWCNLTSTLLRDESDQPLYFISVVEDITQKRLDRQRIEMINNQLQSILDASSLALIIATDREGVIQVYNSGAHRMLGYTADEVIGRQTPVLFHLESEIAARAQLLSARLNRPVAGFDVFVAQAEFASYEERQWTLVHKDGHHIKVNLGVTCIRDDQGNAVGYLGVAQDITEQLKAQQELREKEERLRITLRSIGDAVIATDNAGNVMQMNPVAEQLTGWSAKDAVGQSLEKVFTIINAQTRKPIPNPVQKVLECGEIVGLANHTVLLCADGSEYQIADSGAPIRSDTGQIVGVVLVFRDVTGEYAMQQQLRQSEKMQAVGQLAGGIAHDFNNMLGGILGSAELLSERLPQDKTTEELMQIIMQSGKRAADLTGKLLTFSRKQPSTSMTLDVHRVIHETITLLKQTIDRRIDLVFEPTDQSALVTGDASQLQNAFLNLGINASHAMPQGGKLTIHTETVTLGENDRHIGMEEIKPGMYLKINITDTGTGIAPEHLNRIFEPFFTTKQQGEGTGLGLSAVFATIKQHDGTITVESELGQGTHFAIYLPLTTQTNQPTESDMEVSRVAGTGHIMVVDDEKVMRVTAKAILEDLGYQVTTAEDGQEALDLFTQNPRGYDLIVLDMMMPKLNGKDCFLAMKKLNPDIRVILSTGYTPESELLQMKAAGLTAWVTKPYMSGPLSQMIQDVLQQTQA